MTAPLYFRSDDLAGVRDLLATVLSLRLAKDV